MGAGVDGERTLLDVALMVLGMLVALLGTLLLTFGVLVPAAAIEGGPSRRGEVRIGECSTTVVPLGWASCTGRVRWEPGPRPHPRGVQSPDGETVTVHARHHLFGRVAVESHHSHALALGDDREWIVPSGPVEGGPGRACVAKAGAATLALSGLGISCLVAFGPRRRGISSTK